MKGIYFSFSLGGGGAWDGLIIRRGSPRLLKLYIDKLKVGAALKKREILG